uniref:hypothetical protein n=1 Tax=Sphingobium yanoikuyae TaxID=13690 RepID=UPI000262C7E9
MATDISRKLRKVMIAEAAPEIIGQLTDQFGDFDAPVFVTVADGVAAMDVGKLFYALAPAGDAHD